MSIEEFEANFQYKMKNINDLFDFLKKNLPDKNYHNPDKCLEGKHPGWCQIIKEALEESGYDVVYNPSKEEFSIEFSRSTKREIIETLMKEVSEKKRKKEPR